MILDLERISVRPESACRHPSRGRVLRSDGLLLFASLPAASIGDLCHVETSARTILPAEVIAFSETLATLAPADSLQGTAPGASVWNTGRRFSIEVPFESRGLVLDAAGGILRRTGEASAEARMIRLETERRPPAALSRKPVSQLLETGIRSIDCIFPVGIGQRIGLFSAAGVGKSTLLATIARNTRADVTVIALIGERGREVNEFIDKALGAQCLEKSIVVIATSDESPMRRVLAPRTAMTIAEYHRSRGRHVLLIVDSLTRTARAIRELGLAMGEIPVRQGYTPSVYTQLPRLIERAGNDSKGSISAFFSVLLGDEENDDPLAEELKSLLDGHIFLSSSEALRGLRPAIDITKSCSRLMSALHDRNFLGDRDTIVRLISRLRKDRDFLIFGGVPDRELKVALELESDFNAFLSQTNEEVSSIEESGEQLRNLAQEARLRLDDTQG